MYLEPLKRRRVKREESEPSLASMSANTPPIMLPMRTTTPTCQRFVKFHRRPCHTTTRVITILTNFTETIYFIHKPNLDGPSKAN